MTVHSDNSFKALKESLRGELIQPDDQCYDTARKVYNGMIDRRPRAIARCADVSDVITALNFAQEHDGIKTMAFPVLQSAFDSLYPPGLQWYWKADFVNELSEKAIALHVEHGSRLPTMHSAMNLYPIDGAAHRVGPKDTAFSYREATWAEVIVGVDPDPGKKERITTWAKEYWDALHPHSAGGAYVNFMMDEGEDQVKDSYRANYHRLAAVKAKFDPTNLFRVNQNIQPASYACRQ
jgi:Berberine and berberine like